MRARAQGAQRPGRHRQQGGFVDGDALRHGFRKLVVSLQLAAIDGNGAFTEEVDGDALRFKRADCTGVQSLDRYILGKKDCWDIGAEASVGPHLLSRPGADFRAVLQSAPRAPHEEAPEAKASLADSGPPPAPGASLEEEPPLAAAAPAPPPRGGGGGAPSGAPPPPAAAPAPPPPRQAPRRGRPAEEVALEAPEADEEARRGGAG